MTQALGNPSLAPKPAPNIYTALLLIAVVAMIVSMVVVLSQLMAPVDAGGYGLGFGDLFSELKK